MGAHQDTSYRDEMKFTTAKQKLVEEKNYVCFILVSLQGV